MVELSFTRPATTAAGIAQSQELAGALVRRWGGTIIDFIAMMAWLAFPLVLLGQRIGPYTLWVTLPALLAYYPVAEGLWGRTLGKLATGSIVVDEHGRPPGIVKAILRTLTRLVEVNPFLLGGIPAGIAVIASSKRQRLGDMLAGTYVIPVKDLPRIREAPEAVFS